MTEKEYKTKISSGEARILLNELVECVLEKGTFPDRLSHDIVLLSYQANELKRELAFGKISLGDYNLGNNKFVENLLDLTSTLRDANFFSKESAFPKLESSKANKANSKIYDLYISLPMTSLTASGLYTYDSLRILLLEFVESVRHYCGWENIYCAALYVNTIEEVLDPLVAASVDIEPLRKSKHYVLLYPEKLHSSCIVESGIALGLKIPSFYFVKNADDLPYILKEASGAIPHIYTKEFNTFNEIPSWVARQGWRILKSK